MSNKNTSRKMKVTRTCQTYHQTLPAQPAEAKKHCTGSRSSPHSRSCARRHHSWARGIGSSARLESVAHVENTVMDVYYRNDSMKSVMMMLEGCTDGYCVAEQYGVDLVLTKSRNKIRLDREGKKFYRRWRAGCARMRLAGEGPQAFSARQPRLA